MLQKAFRVYEITMPSYVTVLSQNGCNKILKLILHDIFFYQRPSYEFERLFSGQYHCYSNRSLVFVTQIYVYTVSIASYSEPVQECRLALWVSQVTQ